MEDSTSKPIVTTSAAFTRKQAVTILVVLVLLNIINYMDRSVINVAMESIKLEFSLTDSQLGIMQSIFMIGVGILILPAGFLVDRTSQKVAVMIMGLVWSVATITTGLSATFMVLIISRFICGAGEAGFNPGGTAWLSIAFEPKHRAIVNSIFAAAASIGMMMGNMLGGLLITKTGQWHTPFLVFGAIGIAMSFLTLLLKDYKPPVAVVQKRQTAAVETKELFKKKTMIWISISQGLFVAAVLGFSAWLPSMLIRVYHLSAVEAGAVFSSMVIPALLGPVLGGWLADQFAKKTPIGRPLFTVIGTLLSALCIGIKAYYVGEVSVGTYTLILVLTAPITGLQGATYQAINMDVFPPHQRGKAAAMVGMVTFLGFTWWGPGVIGFASDFFGGGNAGLRYALMLLVPVCLLSALSAALCCSAYRRERLSEEAIA